MAEVRIQYLRETDSRAQFQRAHRRVYDTFHVFNHMQNSPTPLTPEEVRKLIKRRPWLWERFRAWAKDR